jgi:uncharacterized repeat protein (TIGR01451 family)
VRPGQEVDYRLRVLNVSPAAVRGVRVCDRQPSELRFVSASRRPRLRSGERCWQIARIAARRSASIRVTARVLDGARGSVRNRATLSVQGAPETTRVRRTRTLRVQAGGGAPTTRPGGVTG